MPTNEDDIIEIEVERDATDRPLAMYLTQPDSNLEVNHTIVVCGGEQGIWKFISALIRSVRTPDEKQATIEDLTRRTLEALRRVEAAETETTTLQNEVQRLLNASAGDFESQAADLLGRVPS